MINDNNQKYRDDDSDELWDDDLEISSGTRHDSDHDHDSDSDDAFDSGYESDPESESDSGIIDEEDSEYSDHDAEDEEMPHSSSGKRTLRKSLFDFKRDEEGDDFFNNDVAPEPAPKPKAKRVILEPEDPDYWMEEESEFAHIIPKPKKMWKWWIAGVFVILCAIIGLWIWFFNPYVDDAVKYGYIKSMERRGSVVKTFEGVLIPYRELGDPTPTYFEEIRFSVDGDSLAAQMKGMMLECIPVRLEYEVYHTPLFWKGAEKMIITKADTADVNKILPPEYR